MKTLLILRHAKAKTSDADDFDRSLKKQGKRDARRIGRLLRDENMLPDLIVSSSAERCRKTVEHVLQDSGYRGETRLSGALYEANADALREFLRKLSDEVNSVVLVGHNPGLEELLEPLVGAYTPLSTSALAKIELSIDSWRDMSRDTRGHLSNVWQPRELGD
jgi:phosphohistidine phosphatase